MITKNPTAENGKDFGGFNYCKEDSILRWLHRGDTIYDVEIPKTAHQILKDKVNKNNIDEVLSE